MKIWIDLRTKFTTNNFLLDEIINIFLEELSKNKDYFFNIYLSKKNNIKKEFKNMDFFYLNYEETSIENQISHKNLLNEHKNDLILFFGLWRPIFYRWKNILIINNLDNLLYETEEVNNFAKKFKYFFLLEYSCFHTEKILAFNKESQIILNEKVNIPEEKIEINYPFFFKKELEEIEDITQKNQFLIYNSWNSKQNLEIILESIYEYNKQNIEKLDLVIVWEDYDDIKLRKKALELDLINNIKEVENNSKHLKWYYKNAICTIYPSYFENFPIELNDAISFNSPILAAQTESIKEIFQDKIKYFKHSSKLDFLKKLEELKKQKINPDYTEFFEKYSLEKFNKNLMDNIKNIS